MTITDTAAPTVRPVEGTPREVHDELLNRARALLPAIKARALQTEKDGFVPPETVEDLKAAGLLRAATPVEYGGYAGIDYDTSLEIANILAQGCTSTGWCYSVWMSHNWMSAGYTKQMKEEYYANGPDTLAITCSSPKFSTVTVEDDGYRVTGHWSFGSGSKYAQWAMVQVPELLCGANVPRSDIEVLDTWTSPGLKGTGSHQIRATAAHIPAYRLWTPMDDGVKGGPLGYQAQGTPSHRLTMWMLAFTIVAPIVGGARGALETFRAKYAGTSGMGRTGANESLQVTFAEAAAEIDAADLIWRTDLKTVLEQAASGEPFGLEQRATIRRNHAYVAKLAVRAVTRLFEATGASALVESDALQRFFRDVHAASHHITVPWEPTLAVFGSTALEQPFDMEFQRDGIDPDLNAEMAALRGVA